MDVSPSPVELAYASSRGVRTILASSVPGLAGWSWSCAALRSQLARGDVVLAAKQATHARCRVEPDSGRDRVDLQIGVNEQRLGGGDADTAQLAAVRGVEPAQLALQRAR